MQPSNSTTTNSNSNSTTTNNSNYNININSNNNTTNNSNSTTTNNNSNTTNNNNNYNNYNSTAAINKLGIVTSVAATTTQQSAPVRRRSAAFVNDAFFRPSTPLQLVGGEQPTISAKMDKGFFVALGDWTCYRRNYFQVSAAFAVGASWVVVHGQTVPATFSLAVSSRVAGSDRSVDLVQHTAKRDKGPQHAPSTQALGSGGNVLRFGDGCVATWERLQFKSATANNGKRRAAQQYYCVVVDLWAHTALGSVRVATCSSTQLVVRGRSPGHYDGLEEHSHSPPSPTTPHSAFPFSDYAIHSGQQRFSLQQNTLEAVGAHPAHLNHQYTSMQATTVHGCSQDQHTYSSHIRTTGQENNAQNNTRTDFNIYDNNPQLPTLVLTNCHDWDSQMDSPNVPIADSMDYWERLGSATSILDTASPIAQSHATWQHRSSAESMNTCAIDYDSHNIPSITTTTAHSNLSVSKPINIDRRQSYSECLSASYNSIGAEFKWPEIDDVEQFESLESLAEE